MITEKIYTIKEMLEIQKEFSLVSSSNYPDIKSLEDFTNRLIIENFRVTLGDHDYGLSSHEEYPCNWLPIKKFIFNEYGIKITSEDYIKELHIGNLIINIIFNPSFCSGNDFYRETITITAAFNIDYRPSETVKTLYKRHASFDNLFHLINKNNGEIEFNIKKEGIKNRSMESLLFVLKDDSFELDNNKTIDNINLYNEYILVNYGQIIYQNKVKIQEDLFGDSFSILIKHSSDLSSFQFNSSFDPFKYKGLLADIKENSGVELNLWYKQVIIYLNT